MPDAPHSRIRPPLSPRASDANAAGPAVDPPRGGGRVAGGLATKIILIVFLSTFLTAVLVSWISVYSTHAFLRRGLDQTLPAVVSSAADRTRSWLNEAHFELSEWASAGDAPSDATLAHWLQRSHHFEALVRTDSSGQILASAGIATGLELPGVPGFWVADDATGNRLVGTGLAVGSSDEECCLHGVLSRSRMRPLLAVEGLGTGGSVDLVDPDGHVLVSGRSTHPERRGARLPVDLLRSGVVADYAGSDETRRIGAMDSVPHTILSVVVEQPYDAAFEPLFAMVKRVLVIDLGILMFFSLVAYTATRAIVRPIRALSDGAQRISQGELDVELVESEKRDEIGLLTRTFNDMTRKLLSHRIEIERANHKLVAQNAELQRANEVLEQLSITDGLTRLHNHRFFQDHLTREIKRVSRTSENLSMLMCDIDDFKRLNDRLGHASGDELLVGIASTLDESVRETDFLARYGGEEFVVLCPDTDLAGAINVAEKVRSAVAEGSFILDGTSQLCKITISIGVAQFEGSRRAFFKAADQSLYRAKEAGKNCVKSAREVSGYPDI